MASQPLPHEPDPDARAARRLAVAHRLVEMGLEVAEAVQRRALAQMARDEAAAEDDSAADDAAAKGRPVDPVAAVERAARMVRLSLALEARLDEGEPVRRARMRGEAKAQWEADAEAESRARQAQLDAHHREREAREDTVIAVVAQALDAEGVEAGEERLLEIYERLREREWEYDLGERPNGAVIARFCADYRLDPDWSVWAQTDWAVEEAATNARGSPYAAGFRPPPARVDDEDAAEAVGQSP